MVSSSDSLKLLLQAVEESVVSKGCQRTTMQDLMNITGLSKGAIYHYVKSKEELFGLVLHERLHKLNDQFYSSLTSASGLTEPLHVISQGLSKSHHPEDVMNQILIYLLSQKEKAGISSILQQFHEQFIEVSMGWIKFGQQYGVIDPGIDARRTAEHFQILSYGLRMRNLITGISEASEAHKIAEFNDQDFLEIMKRTFRGGV